MLRHDSGFYTYITSDALPVFNVEACSDTHEKALVGVYYHQLLHFVESCIAFTFPAKSHHK